MKLSIIIVNYRSKIKTLNCLKSIYDSKGLDSIDFEIIVVNNSPEENLKQTINKKFKQVKVITSFNNLGMGGGNNLGIKASQGEFILILNPDTRVYEESIKKLLTYIETNSQISIVGPKLVNPDGSLQYSCSHFPRFYTPVIRRTFLKYFFTDHLNWFLMKDYSHNRVMEVDWLMGSCLMIRKADWTFFDSRYFMYFEDIDLCREAKEKNKKVIYYPEARVVHDHTRESAKLSWYKIPLRSKIFREHVKSWLKYFIKWKLQLK